MGVTCGARWLRFIYVMKSALILEIFPFAGTEEESRDRISTFDIKTTTEVEIEVTIQHSTFHLAKSLKK